LSRREDIETYIWQDEDFDALSGWAALLYIWSFTNDHCNMAGLYRVKRHTMLESKVPANKLDAALDELIAANYVRFERGVMWVRSRVKHLRSKHPNYAVSIAKSVAVLPVDHPLRAAFLAEYAHYGWLASELTPLNSDTVSTVYEDRKDTVDRVSPNPVIDENSLHPNDTVSTPSERCMGKGMGIGKGKDVSSKENLGEKLRDGGSGGKGRAQLVADLFAYWQQQCHHPNAVLDDKRKRRIDERLKSGRTPDEIRAAIDGAARNAYINQSGVKHDDIELICRDDSKLELFIQRSKAAPGLFAKTSAISSQEKASQQIRELRARSESEVIDSTAEEVAA